MDEMELALRKSAAFKMRVIGVFMLLGGIALLGLGVVADVVRLVILGGVLGFVGVLQLVRASKHLRGDA